MGWDLPAQGHSGRPSSAWQGEGQVSHQGCKTCSRCTLGKSQQGTALTCELPLSQAQGLEAEPNFETKHWGFHAAASYQAETSAVTLKRRWWFDLQGFQSCLLIQNLTYARKTPGGRYWPLQETDCIFNFPNKIKKNLEHFRVTNYLASARALSAPCSHWQGLPLFLCRILQILTAISQSFSKGFCTTPDAHECISLLLRKEISLIATNDWAALRMSDSAQDI